MSSSDTKFFGIKANNPLSNLESLLVAGLPALFKEQEQKRKEKQIKERSQGWVSIHQF